MDLSDILTPAAIVPALHVSNKRQLLQLMARRGAELTGIAERRLLGLLVSRERLGTTGLGGGIAIPHARVPGLARITGLFARLDAPVEYEAIDRQPVELVFTLLSPENGGAEHLKALARVSRLFRDAPLVAKLRGSASADALYALLCGHAQPRAA